MKLIDFAIQMELDGKTYYEKLLCKTPTVWLQQILSILAADEQKHYEVLNDLRSGVARDLEDSVADEEAKNIFKIMKIEESVVEELRTKLDVYQYAMRMEAESIKVYEEIAKKESQGGDPTVLSVVMKIIDEEKKHYNCIENIHDYIAANERMVPWHEFKGIKETFS